MTKKKKYIYIYDLVIIYSSLSGGASLFIYSFICLFINLFIYFAEKSFWKKNSLWNTEEKRWLMFTAR